MSTTVSQSMLPRLAFSFPHTQAEEIQNTSLVVLESDLSHDFSQAVHKKIIPKMESYYNRRVLGLLIFFFQPELGNLIYIWFSFIVYARNDT